MKCFWRISMAWLGLTFASAVATAQTNWDRPGMIDSRSVTQGMPTVSGNNDFSPPNQSWAYQTSASYSQVPQAPNVPSQSNPQLQGTSQNCLPGQTWGPAYGSGSVQSAPGYEPGSANAINGQAGTNNGYFNPNYRNGQSALPGTVLGPSQGGTHYYQGPLYSAPEQVWNGPATSPGHGTYFADSTYGHPHARVATIGGVGRNARNIVLGANGLVFFRDYEDDIGLSGNSLGQSMFSTDASHSALGGVELFAQTRNANGRGFEARYWGLFSGCGGTFISDTPFTVLDGLSLIQHDPAGTSVQGVFNVAGAHELCRSNRMHNVEINRLINVGNFNGLFFRNASYELLHGARWFEFDEVFEYSAISTVAPTRLDYRITSRNTLMGYQFGGRGSHFVTDRLQLISGVRFGLFNNHIRHRQRMSDETGFVSYINSGPNAGMPYDFSSSKNDLATLGELDLGLGYLLSNRCRAVVGYRLIGVTGLALAPNQIPVNFTDVNQIERINSNSGLLLHGFFGGLNFCF